MTELLIADDHPLFRLALVQSVRDILPTAIMHEADTLAGTRAVLAAYPGTDLVLLDLHMPGNHGLLGLVALRNEFPSVAVLLVSADDDPAMIRRALDYGAAGYIPKSSDLATIRAGLQAVLACEQFVPAALRHAVFSASPDHPDRLLARSLAPLTVQQLRVLTQVAEGRLNKQIADSLSIQERTVKAHLTAIFEKLGVRNRTQASGLLHRLDRHLAEVDQDARV